MNIQKQAFLNNEKRPKEKQLENYTSMPLWWLGMFGVILGSVGDILALGFATQSLVVASGGATVLLSNCLISSWWHREHQGVTAIAGVFCIIGGAVVFAVLSPPSQDYDLEKLQQLALHNIYFILYLVVVAISVSIALSLIATSSLYKKRHGVTVTLMSPVMKRMKQQYKHIENREQELEDRIEVLEDVVRKLVEDVAPQRHSIARSLSRSTIRNAKSQYKAEEELERALKVKFKDPYIYATTAGIMGSLSVILASCAMKVIRNAIVDFDLYGKDFHKPAVYLFIGGMISTVLIQTHLLNMALKYGDVLTVFPVFQAFWIGFGIVGGMVFYQVHV
jgi:hypothetical protein